MLIIRMISTDEYNNVTDDVYDDVVIQKKLNRQQYNLLTRI